MTIAREVKPYWDIYSEVGTTRKTLVIENMDFTKEHADAVDKAMDEVRAVLRCHNIPCANDDRAESLVGAIARYVVESSR